jgi:4-hydroxybenzoate polyprenyltransferase/phosphoserine phosphatase
VSRPAHLAKTDRPLCVDLDGTLVKSDTLVDSLLVLLRTHPLKVLRLPGMVLKGKAAFKAFVTSSVTLDVAHLPYNRTLLQYLQAEHAGGRAIYLATGADERLAQRVADHLGIFAGVLGSDGATNLTGDKKLDSLKARLSLENASSAFDYIGNDTPDLPLLAEATEPMVANPSMGLQMGMKSRGIHPAKSFNETTHPLQALIKAARPHQWAKNLLIFLPVLLAHTFNPAKLLAALGAFCCFSLAASSTYIFNDLLDLEADRRHPRKRLRPFASGDLSGLTGIATSAILLLIGLIGGSLLPGVFFAWLLVYLVTTVSYSWYLKRVALVDVLVLSGLYTLRMQAGSAATDTPISHWLAGLSIFLFLSLAVVKRFAELENLRLSGAPLKNGRGYLISDTEQLRAFGTASGYAAVVIFAIYISGRDVTALYRNPSTLWFIVPLIILWISRIWLLASRGELNEDPVVFALTDRLSLLIGIAVAAVAFAAL